MKLGVRSGIDLVTGESGSATTSFATPSTPTAFETTKLGCMLEVEPDIMLATYMNANAGMCMPRFRQVTPEVLSFR